MMRHPEGTKSKGKEDKMKQTLLSILFIGILLLSACAAPTTAPEVEAPPTEETTPEAETPPSETQSEKLPYSWTEGVMFYTIEVAEGEGYWGADEWDFYEVCLGYKNTSHETTKWNLRVGGFKLKTDVGNVYGLESGGLHGSELAPQDEGEFVATVFKIHQGEVPVELWWYQVVEGKPSIIFELEEQPETPPSEPQIQKLPCSWAEGDFLITVHEVFKASLGENWNDYRIRISYKNTLKRTTKAHIEIGDLKLKTDAGNLYDLESSGGTSCYESFAPEQSREAISCSFRIRKTEKPTELWLYEHGWYTEEPNIIFKLSEPTLIAKIGDTILGCAGKQNLSLTLLWWKEKKITVCGPYVDGYYTFAAKPGMKFIILAYEFRNNGIEEQTTPYLRIGEIVTAPERYHYDIFTPPSGIHSEEYKPRKATAEEIDTLIGDSASYENLLPEESVVGCVAFEIPEDATPIEAKIASIPYKISLEP